MFHPKKIIVLLFLFITLCTVVIAQEPIEQTYKMTIDFANKRITMEEQSSQGEIDNSDLLVEVVKYANGIQSPIYAGPLSGYDNGAWINTNFGNAEYLMILDWKTMNDEAIYVIPLSKSNDSRTTTTEVENIVDLSSIINENMEQSLQISATQLIEYDVTYSIVSDGSLSMDIDYNVYNGNSKNDTVSLIAVLYENGRLSDIQTQNLSVDALDSNSDSILLPLPNNRENYSVKLMVWDGMGTLRPIGNAKQVVDLDDYTREKYMYITSNANVGFNVYMNAATVKGANDDAVHTLKYDSTKISPVDLCGFTYNKELAAGAITNTNITIQNADLSAGKIEYKFNLEAGRNTGITNMVKFKTLSDVTDETIVYTIQ